MAINTLLNSSFADMFDERKPPIDGASVVWPAEINEISKYRMRVNANSNAVRRQRQLLKLAKLLDKRKATWEVRPAISAASKSIA